MRPMNMRSRTARVTAGALAIATPASAVALAADQADAQSAFQLKPAASHLGYGQTLTLTGVAPAGESGQRLALEFSTSRSPWRAIAFAKVHSDGAFRLRAPLTRSGEVRVAAVPAAAAPVHSPATPGTPSLPPAVAAAGAPPLTVPGSATTTAPLVASAPERVAVTARLIAPAGTLDALGSQPLALRGALLPRHAGRRVQLQGLVRGRWRTLAGARTRASGRYVLDYVPRETVRSLRVIFPGDAGNSAVHSRVRHVVDLLPALASWYYDAGNTACGFHAGLGIANPYLPCGTRVTLAYHGRTVTAVVDDRGPFVGGRQYDLNQTTAATLGFGGVDTVWSVVQPAPSTAGHPKRSRKHRHKPTARHHRTPSGARRSLAGRCPAAASPTSIWTRSTCPSSSVAVPSFAAGPSWLRGAGLARS